MDMQEIFNNDQPVLRLSKDLKDAAKTLSEDEAPMGHWEIGN